MVLSIIHLFSQYPSLVTFDTVKSYVFYLEYQSDMLLAGHYFRLAMLTVYIFITLLKEKYLERRHMLLILIWIMDLYFYVLSHKNLFVFLVHDCILMMLALAFISISTWV